MVSFLKEKGRGKKRKRKASDELEKIELAMVRATLRRSKKKPSYVV